MKSFKRAAVAAAGIAALVIVFPVTAQAKGAPHHGRMATVGAEKTKTYKIKVKRGKSKVARAASSEAPHGGGCLPPILGFAREDLCLVIPITIIVVQLEDGTPDGSEETYKFGVQTQVSLSPASTRFDIEVTAVALTTSGDDPALDPSVTITSQCDHPCSITSPQIMAVGTPEVAEGGASNEVITHPDHVVWPEPAISLYADYGGDESNTVSWPIVPVIRCDHMYPREWRKPGCVFPDFTPTVDMSSLPVIAENIRKVQGRGIHVGRPGGRHPLHRNSGSQERDKNRHLVCPKHEKRPPGSSCDEYPFASTVEGGTSLPPIDRYRGWVPAHENQSQGVILSRFYRVNRILRGSPGDAFYVHA